MESTRRPFNRSIAKEPGLKKARLTVEPAAPNPASNGRAGFIQRPEATNSVDSGGQRLQRERDSMSRDSVRGGYQPQPPAQQQLLYQELVDQYKTALAELTFNSKPFITNLTIIAGENLHAAKAIAATVCANILEVPSEQKLPSLYLLDSIVKNIGRDYIKHFASRLPEVFCKVYRQVDPLVHPGMRHLFGTWKRVFPSQTLQRIADELEFSTTVNGSSSISATRPDSQVQRPAHSIHVNPKYLEARQRLQTTKDVEVLEGPTNISSGRPWSDSYAKSVQHHDRDQLPQPLCDKTSHADSEYGSSVSGCSGVGTGIMSEKFKERRLDKPGNNVTGKISSLKNGFDTKPESHASKPTSSDSHRQLKQNFTSKSSEGMSKSWQNSDEEEYTWDEMNSKPANHAVADASAKDRWTPDNCERLDFHSHIQRADNMHGIGSGVDSECLAPKLGEVASVNQAPFVWSQELQPSEKRMLSATGKNISGYSEGYSTGLRNSTNPAGKTPYASQIGLAHAGGPSSNFSGNVVSGTKVSMTQHDRTLGVVPSLMQSPPLPSFPAHDGTHLLNNFAKKNQNSVGPPTDPRKLAALRNRGPTDQSSQVLPLPYQDVYQASTRKTQPQSLRAMTSPLQFRKHVSPTQHGKLEVLEFESFGDEENLYPAQLSISENLPTRSSSPKKSNILTLDSPGQSITSSLLAAVVKSGTLGGNSLIVSSNSPDFQEFGSASSLGVQPPLQSGPSLVKFLSSQKKLEQPLSSLAGTGSQGTPTAVHSASNPVASLLSSLMEKGLISSAKSDSLPSASTQKPNQPPDVSPGVASTSSTPVSSVPVSIVKPLPSIKDEPSSLQPVSKDSESLPESSGKIKDLIGFEFKPNIIRIFQPDVISDLSDLPHRCSICGLRLKLIERLVKHMEWHTLKAHEHKTPNTTTRSWYSNSVEWVAGVGQFHPGHGNSSLLGESGEEMEIIEQMVPADESQCACILCGELFEEFYSRERNEWMFSEAVYLITSTESQSIAAKNATANLSPIVHANCITEDSVRDLGSASDAKLEKDA